MAFDAQPEKVHPNETEAEAEGIIYSTHELAPQLKMFRCQPYRMLLSTKACAARWLKAQEAYGEAAYTLAACSACATGAVHAGQGRVYFSPWYKRQICPRCSRGGLRMIGNRRCVSCYNREREMKAGRNARGNKPVELLERPLRRVELLVKIDGEVRRVVDHESSGPTETMIQILRVTKGRVTFGCADNLKPVAANDDSPGPGVRLAETSADRRRDLPLDGPELWKLAKGHCEGCGGVVLCDARSGETYRCVDCLTRKELLEAEQGAAAHDGADQSSTSGDCHRLVCRYRAALFATTALSHGIRPLGVVMSG